MDDLTVLVTGSGAPGIAGTIYSLKNNFDGRRIKIIGTDILGEAVGKYMCSRFYQIPRPSSQDYLSRLLSICKKEGVDVLLPQNTAELSVLAEHKDDFLRLGAKVAVSGKNSIDIANNKYELMKRASALGIPVPGFYLVGGQEGLVSRAESLGWPKHPVVIKPPVSNGMRGLRIIDENLDRRNIFFKEKPDGVHVRMKDLLDVLGPVFPELLVMEYLEGDEYTVDALKADRLDIVPRKRDLIKNGITFNGTVERNEEIIGHSRRLALDVGLDYAFGFQFKLDGVDTSVPRLLESNPRVQGTMVLAALAGANVIYGAVKHAVGEEVPEFKVNWGTRILRYWGGIGVEANGESVLGAL